MPWTDLLAYWQSKHIGGLPPARADLDPISEIPGLVQNLLLIDILPDGYRYRLIGSEVVARTGRDATGESINHQQLAPSLIRPWINALDVVIKDRKPQALRSHLHESGASILTLILPLVARDGQTEMVLGGCFYDGASEAPCRPNLVECIDLRVLLAARNEGSPPSALRPAAPLALG